MAAFTGQDLACLRGERHVFERLVVGFLPYEPIWPGLIVDTVVFAFLAWALVQLVRPFDIVHMSRRSRWFSKSTG